MHVAVSPLPLASSPQDERTRASRQLAARYASLLAAALASAFHRLQCALCTGHMRTEHSLPQKLATRQPMHSLILLSLLPQPAQHS